MPVPFARGATAVIAAVPVLLSGCGSQQSQSSNPAPPGSPAPLGKDDGENSEPLRSLKVLQWNPHWECFVSSNDGSCGANALGALSSLLPEHSIDFANVIEINEEADVYRPPSPWSIMTTRCGDPVTDSTALIYDASRWAPVSEALEGCMEYDDRPFIVQAFRRLASSDKVIFVGAHFPHGDFDSTLANAVSAATRATQDVLGVIFAADTNRGSSTSTASILRGIVPTGMTNNIQSAQLYPTCCHNDGYTNDYDRIAATFATGVTTQVLFDPAPSWADIQRPSGAEGEFHKALVSTFQLAEADGRAVLA